MQSHADIVVKDMSRLEHDYLKVSYYTEVAFPEAEVRFITTNNGVDNANQQDSDFIPFLNIIKNIHHRGKALCHFSLFRQPI